MILKIILLYLILNSIYIYNSKRKVVDYYISSSGIFIKNLFVIFSYVIVFLGFFRLLRFLQENNTLNFKYFFCIDRLITFFFFLILLWLVRRFILMYTKVTFFKIHYYLLSPNSNSSGWNRIYLEFYLSKIYGPIIKYFKYFKLINMLLTIILILLIFRDLVFNELVLSQSIGFLKWFGVFKFFFIIIKFVATKQDLELDYYAYNYTYPGDCVTGPFWTKLTPEMDVDLDLKENKYRFEVIAK